MKYTSLIIVSLALLFNATPVVAASKHFLCRPVSDKINYFFHDPSYPYIDLFEHTGIDFNSTAGTPIYASARGTVLDMKRPKTPDFAYILLQHKQDISTMYGHISKAFVSKGDTVYKGQLIALSGGTPGSNGAGTYTTGAHLHFEVLKYNIPVRPKPYWQHGVNKVCNLQ